MAGASGPKVLGRSRELVPKGLKAWALPEGLHVAPQDGDGQQKEHEKEE